jgi:pimeloyl-ACP methyl ester carboxylesterase
MFEPIMPLLADAGFTALAMDVPGYGESFRLPHPTMDAYAESLRRALDTLRVAGLDIVGNHGGATIAMTMAAAEPHRVRRLVLWGVGHFGGTPTESPSGSAPPRGRFSADGSDIAAFWRNGFKFTQVVSPQFHVRRMIDLLQAGYDSAGHGPGDAVDHPALAKRVGQPVLVMSGENDEVWESSQIAARVLPDARFEPIHDASVYVAEEFPERFASAIVRFLKA